MLEDEVIAEVEPTEDTDSSGEPEVVETPAPVESAPALPADVAAKLAQYEQYEASHKFVDQFGGIEALQAKVDLDAAIRSGDPVKIHQAIAERNARAVTGLANHYGAQGQQPVDETAILEKYLGKGVNQETLREFAAYRESPDRFSNIPEEFRFIKDEYGQLTPRAPDDPVLQQAQFFQKLIQNQANELAALKSEVRQPKEVEAQQRFEQQWTASQDRLVGPVKDEATKLGLYTAPAGETPEAKAEREYQLKSFVYASTGEFQNDPQVKRDLAELEGHYQRGETVAAREKEAKLSRRMREIAQANIQVVGKNWTAALQKKTTVVKKATSAKTDPKTVNNSAKLPDLLEKAQQKTGGLGGLADYIKKHPQFQGRPEVVDEILGQRHS
ncbi:MAG TPA: hypothetical protein VN476_03985 [Pyrinomonadaceae bacterium]|nr:hypothetical protein [Pyrinomonadaceae bacterium]